MANKIVGTGSCLPERCVSNQELSEKLAQSGIETSHDWIVARTGIEQRYLANSTETTSYLAAKAAFKALESANVSPDEVDLIIVATTTPDHVFPSTACLVQNILGAKNAFAFDVQAVCSGFVYGLSVADALLSVGKAKCAVVIGAENFSKLLDWSDRSTCVLFGDGAGAVVVQSEHSEGILASKLYSDGSLSSILSVPGNFCNGQVVGDPFVKMDGQAVYKTAINALESSAKEVVSMAGLTLDDVDWMIPHQANIRIIQSTAKRLGIAEQKVVVTVNVHANTSAASVPLALDLAVRDGRIQSQQTVLLQGVGGGFTWGALLARF